MDPKPAPEWQTTAWLNTDAPLDLEQLRGRVVVVHAFQMLCPGCVSHGIPQVLRVAELFARAPLTVVGLHTVFEHHDAMTPISLRAFLHEYRIGFPVGVDEPDATAAIPRTMAAYQMRGTPTLLLYDRQGRLRRHMFGHVSDMQLGTDVMALVGSQDDLRTGASTGGTCTPERCN